MFKRLANVIYYVYDLNKKRHKTPSDPPYTTQNKTNHNTIVSFKSIDDLLRKILQLLLQLCIYR
jgi:hypothetical protein